MISRRCFLAATTGVASLPGFKAKAAPQLGLDGLWQEAWLIRPKALGEAYAAALHDKKAFVIFWEARGCPWCKLLHTVNLVRDDISTYMQANFLTAQYDIRGANEVTDFDGQKLPEESLSLKYDVMSTPLIQFFPPKDASKPKELGRIGYVKPDDFLLMLRFVHERGYESGPFQAWAKNQLKDG